jgi:predicted DNA-binding protein
VVVSVRMPAELRDRVSSLAENEDRPLSREIVHLLKIAVELAERGNLPKPSDRREGT